MFLFQKEKEFIEWLIDRRSAESLLVDPHMHFSLVSLKEWCPFYTDHDLPSGEWTNFKSEPSENKASLLTDQKKNYAAQIHFILLPRPHM